jgi:biotin-dependent carboxylase-like uncharacterized protein
MIEVLDAGPRSLLMDLGRPGWSHIGVGPSGAFDRAALRLANRLVGNHESAPCIESLGGGLRLKFHEPTVISITGAMGEFTKLTDGRSTTCSRNAPVDVAANDVVIITTPSSGLRSYLAIRGGINVESTLGSASTDSLAGIGPTPLSPGTELRTAQLQIAQPPIDLAVRRSPEGPINVIQGPRWDWFTDTAHALLQSQPWTVSPVSDRIGIRLDGSELQRSIVNRELPSEPMVTGAIQVPPSGLPVILGPDRPTTGGYPVIAVVIDAHLDRLAQLTAGDAIRFKVTRLD